MTNSALPLLDVGPTARVKVRRVLLDLSAVFGNDLNVRQADIARAAGCTREAVNRELASLRAAGVVATGRSRVILLDRDDIAASVSA